MSDLCVRYMIFVTVGLKNTLKLRRTLKLVGYVAPPRKSDFHWLNLTMG